MPPVRDQFRFEPTVAGALRRYWWLVVAMAVLGAAGGAGYSLLQHKQYTSSASLAIPPPTSQQLLGSAATGTTTEYIAGQVAILKSPQVAEQAAKIVQKEFGSTPDAATIEKNAVITPPVNAGNGSSASEAATATITYTARKPKLAADIANAIVTGYGIVRADGLKAQAQAAVGRLTASLNSINAQLSAITTQINTLQSQENSSSAAQQQALIASGAKGAHVTTSQSANLQSLLAQQSALDKQQADVIAHQNTIETNLEQALAQSLSTVPATVSKSPSSPKTTRNILLGFLILALLGILIAYIVALRRRRFADRHDPSGLYQAPLLGDVPRLQFERISSALPVSTNPISAAAESFRFLAASLGTALPVHDHLPVILTSATPGSGKTTMSANLATALAERGWRVLAVDADFIRRGLSTLLLQNDGSEGPGLTEVLSGRVDVEEAAQPALLKDADSLVGELHVLGAGPTGYLLPGIVATTDPEEFRRKICRRYDAVVVDGPPLAGAAFAADLASLVGNIIVVVNHDDLVGPQLDFIDQLHATSGRVIGYIYNRAPLRKELASYYKYQVPIAADPRHAGSHGRHASRDAVTVTSTIVADPPQGNGSGAESPSGHAEPAQVNGDGSLERAPDVTAGD